MQPILRRPALAAALLAAPGLSTGLMAQWQRAWAMSTRTDTVRITLELPKDVYDRALDAANVERRRLEEMLGSLVRRLESPQPYSIQDILQELFAILQGLARQGRQAESI